jgi:hypothetical protein
MSSGDKLAAGAKSAMFGPPKISQEKWDKIWAEDEDKIEVYRSVDGKNWTCQDSPVIQSLRNQDSKK